MPYYIFEQNKTRIPAEAGKVRRTGVWHEFQKNESRAHDVEIVRVNEERPFDLEPEVVDCIVGVICDGENCVLTNELDDPNAEPYFVFRYYSNLLNFEFISDGEKYAFLTTPYGWEDLYSGRHITECEYCTFSVDVQNSVKKIINKFRSKS